VDQQIEGDLRGVGPEATIDLSVVCPFYNEEAIIAGAIRGLLTKLERFGGSWELIVVDDGSADQSRDLAEEIARNVPELRVLGYGFNRGRGHALRTGIGQARGEIIVTTEIDLSWGEEIVERLYEVARSRPDVDVVIASPHMPGGGYKNVPAKRVFLSRLGNWVIRAFMVNAASMNTGMTRAYRRRAIRALPLQEDGKEFHLEVVLKAEALGYRFAEIPALLEWKEYKHEGRRVARKSSSRVNRLVLTHSLFSLFANPIRYVWALSALCLLVSTGFFAWGIVRYLAGLVSVFMLIVSLAFAIIAVMLFAFGLVVQQGNMIQQELWRLRQDVAHLESAAANREGREDR